jgi:uncharacterized cupin superfamily protein
MPAHATALAAAPAAPEHYHLPAAKLIRGNPLQTVWLQHRDPDGRFLVGLWHSEPGKWHVTYTEHEYFHILEGRSVLTDAQGHAVTLCAGQEWVVPRGFTGTWEVLEATRKRFVIHEPGNALPEAGTPAP